VLLALLPALPGPGVTALELDWLRLGETGHRCSLFYVRDSGWGARWLPLPGPAPLCRPLPCRPGGASISHGRWRMALLAAQGLQPGTALGQLVQPWCPESSHNANWCRLHCTRCPDRLPSPMPLPWGWQVGCCRALNAVHAENQSNTSRAMRLAAGCRPVQEGVPAGCWCRLCARRQRCGWASLKVPALGCYAFLDSAGQVLYGCIHIGLLDGLLQEGALLIP